MLKSVPYFINVKIVLLIVLCGLFQPNYSISQRKKNGTTVEDAEKVIAKDRQRKLKIAKKAHNDALKAHWDRQSSQSKKTVKLAKRRYRKLQRDKRKANRERKKLSKR